MEFNIDFFQTIGIITAIAVSISAIIINFYVQRSQVYNSILQNQRDLGIFGIEHEDKLVRITKKKALAVGKPITTIERTYLVTQFANWLFLYHASKSLLWSFEDPFKKSIKKYLQGPIQKQVWEEEKEFYPTDFQKFIEEIRENPKL